MKCDFYGELLFKIMASLPNDYTDNYDHERFGEEKMPKSAVAKLYSSDFVTKRFFNKSSLLSRFYQANQTLNDPLFAGLCELFDTLADKDSKDLLVALAAYRLLGHKKVKLPLSTPEYWKKLSECDNLLVGSSSFEHLGQQNKTKIGLYDLGKIGYNIRLDFGRAGVLTDFIIEQYKYQSSERTISVKKGDVVIDCGGFWGDSALYFSSKTGKEGRVYACEFIPGNLKVLRNNLSLNPDLAETIDVVEHPIWDQPGVSMYYIDKGAASNVSLNDLGGGSQKVASVSIDALVEEKKIAKVDFIKMDIEGAEPRALKGAENTIKRFKPTLAIAIYHSLSDFVGIPAYIRSLGLGYKLYLGHYTIHEEETIIFAVAD